MKLTIVKGTITIDTEDKVLMASLAELVAQQTQQTAAMQEIASEVQGLLASQASLMAQVAALQMGLEPQGKRGD